MTDPMAIAELMCTTDVCLAGSSSVWKVALAKPLVAGATIIAVHGTRVDQWLDEIFPWFQVFLLFHHGGIRGRVRSQDIFSKFDHDDV